MATDTERLSEDMRKVRAEVKRLRDEIRVRLHLGAMDAREAFVAIEHDVDHLGQDVTRTSHEALQGVLSRLKQLSAAFRGEPPSAPKNP